MPYQHLMATSYKLDIDPEKENFSESFKDFFHNHFIDMKGLSRREIDTSFYSQMTIDEKEIAKRLIRQNLDLRYVHLIEATGKLKDELALPILYEQLKNTSDLSRQLIIGQAIWRINNDIVYRDLLRMLQESPNHITKEAHFEQVTDFKNMESIEMLFRYLRDEGDFVRYLALSELNHLISGQQSFESKFDTDYFLSRQEDEAFKKMLLQNLQRLL